MTALRVYLDPNEVGGDGYPYAWHGVKAAPPDDLVVPAIKDLVREQAGHRCLRCGHPYRKGRHGRGEWSPCDADCLHSGPYRTRATEASAWVLQDELGAPAAALISLYGNTVEARWRILTVHHLNGVKHDCRWWNLVALCQRCHLSVQARVVMQRVYPFEHSDWFKPYAAAWYAWAYLGEELTREQTMERLEELLALERQA